MLIKNGLFITLTPGGGCIGGVGGVGGGQPAYQPYMPQQIIGQHQQGGAPLIMPNMQDNQRGNSANTNKQQQNKSSYQANSWS